MSDLRTAAQQVLGALEWHYRQGHSNTLGGFRLKIDEKALRNLKAALAQQQARAWQDGVLEGHLRERERWLAQEPDLFHCPKCGGPADNGHDRSIPPNPYFCTRCMAEPVHKCPNCASLEAQNTELDRKLAELERERSNT